MRAQLRFVASNRQTAYCL